MQHTSRSKLIKGKDIKTTSICVDTNSDILSAFLFMLLSNHTDMEPEFAKVLDEQLRECIKKVV